MNWSSNAIDDDPSMPSFPILSDSLRQMGRIDGRDIEGMIMQMEKERDRITQEERAEQRERWLEEQRRSKQRMMLKALVDNIRSKKMVSIVSTGWKIGGYRSNDGRL